MRVIAVSPISMGYGGPQIGYLVSSLLGHYGGGEACILETNQPERPPRPELFPGIELVRVCTEAPPFGGEGFGRTEYVVKASAIVNRRRPDVLIVADPYTLPVLFKLRFRPAKVIYYALELLSPDWDPPENFRIARYLQRYVDLVIHTGENRARLHIERCGYRQVPHLVLYNAPPARPGGHILPPSRRNGAILYQGTIEEEGTLARYLLGEAVQRCRIDLYGHFAGPRRDSLREKLLALRGGVRYCGYLNEAELAQRRRAYDYSIVIWNPSTENRLYASPNKLFESIADGVPPISAPHPQCRKIIDRYRCGLLMEDWSEAAFLQALQRAASLKRSPAYDEMVGGCERATATDLNWERQFEKVIPYL